MKPLIVEICPCHVDLDRETGGVANVVRQICLRASGAGRDVLLLCGNRELGAVRAEPGARDRGGGLRAVVFSQRAHPLLGPTRAFERAIEDLPAACVAHVHTCFSALTERAMDRLTRRGIPLVFTPHGKLSRPMMSRWSSLKRAWWRLRVPPRVLATMQPAVCSVAETRELAGLGIRRAPQVIPNGYDPEGAVPPAAEQRLIPGPYVVFLGYLDPRKQPELAVRALARARSRATHALVIAGPDAYGHRRRIEAAARTAGLDRHVIFYGPAFGAAKWNLLRHADALMLPSRAEGLPVVLCEALAAGLPAIYSSACHFPEVAKDGAGICLTTFDVEAWAEALDRLCTDPAGRLSMRRAAMALAPAYSWDSIVKRWLAFYDRLGRDETLEERCLHG